MPKFYTAYDRPPRVVSDVGGESMTQQQFAQVCDINYIVKRAQRTGTIPCIPNDFVFGDFSDSTFKERMDSMANIKSYFDGLPSNVRLAYGNDVNNLIASMTTDEGVAKARELGLLGPVVNHSPDVTKMVPETEGAPAPEAPQSEA